MIITCEKCKTRYKLKDDAIPESGYKVRCQKCRHIFVVKKNLPESDKTQKKHTPERAASKCKIISICNQKGGVAKTSTCINLGASLMLHKKRVLLVDFDVQANLSMLLGLKNAKSFFEVLHAEDEDLKRFVIKARHNFWVLPSNSKMALLTKIHMQDENFEYLLREKLKSVQHYFDYILIDTPPSGDFYTLNALLASNMAIVPTQCEYLSMNGVNHVVNMISVVREKTDHKLEYRILATMLNRKNVAARAIHKKFRAKYNQTMFNTSIELDEKVQESQIAHMPVIQYDRQSHAGLQYLELAKEIINE
ncbi:MAG: zinc-ribbon domain-containing protein [Gammaproteobacteria bacterium]|nr:zinc-ribbon domain-containing protein [Gammaproteobacteria bacterium]